MRFLGERWQAYSRRHGGRNIHHVCLLFAPVENYSIIYPSFSSNGGVFGSLYGTPIINLPQAAVLGALKNETTPIYHQVFNNLTGMHAIKEKPVVVDGQIVIRPIMVVALTYDHRLLDGREAVTFLGMRLAVKQELNYANM